MNIDAHEFEKLPLDVQIQKWQEYRASGGGSEINHWYLDAIAQKGKPAADAMAPYLTQSDPLFPLKDAILVVRFVASHGVDLRGHPATDQLRILMTTSSDEWVRKMAWSAIRTIDKVDPPWPE